MKLSNPMLFCIVYRGQQADGTACAQTPTSGGRSYFPLDDILRPPAEDMIENIGEELDDDGETWRPYPNSFPRTKTGFQKFQRKLQKRIIGQQRHLKVTRNFALSLCADYDQSVVAYEDVASQREHDNIVNPPPADCLANRKRKSSRLAAN